MQADSLTTGGPKLRLLKDALLRASLWLIVLGCAAFVPGEVLLSNGLKLFLIALGLLGLSVAVWLRGGEGGGAPSVSLFVVLLSGLSMAGLLTLTALAPHPAASFFGSLESQQGTMMRLAFWGAVLLSLDIPEKEKLVAATLLGWLTVCGLLAQTFFPSHVRAFAHPWQGALLFLPFVPVVLSSKGWQRAFGIGAWVLILAATQARFFLLASLLVAPPLLVGRRLSKTVVAFGSLASVSLVCTLGSAPLFSEPPLLSLKSFLVGSYLYDATSSGGFGLLFDLFTAGAFLTLGTLVFISRLLIVHLRRPELDPVRFSWVIWFTICYLSDRGHWTIWFIAAILLSSDLQASFVEAPRMPWTRAKAAVLVGYAWWLTLVSIPSLFAQWQMAQAYRWQQKGKLEGALGKARQAATLFPFYAEFPFYAAMLYVQVPNWEAAAAYFQRALDVYPKPAIIWNLANTKAKSGRNKEARKLYLAAKEAGFAGADEGQMELEIGNTFYNEGRLKEARNFYQKAKEAGAPLSETELKLGMCAFALGDYEDALARWKEAYSAAEDPAFREGVELNLALAYANLGDNRQALDILERLQQAAKDPMVRQMAADQAVMVRLREARAEEGE